MNGAVVSPARALVRANPRRLSASLLRALAEAGGIRNTAPPNKEIEWDGCEKYCANNFATRKSNLLPTGPN